MLIQLSCHFNSEKIWNKTDKNLNIFFIYLFTLKNSFDWAINELIRTMALVFSILVPTSMANEPPWLCDMK